MSSAALRKLSVTLKALHVPGKPLVVANVYDILSAEAVGALPSCKVLATASMPLHELGALQMMI